MLVICKELVKFINFLYNVITNSIFLTILIYDRWWNKICTSEALMHQHNLFPYTVNTCVTHPWICATSVSSLNLLTPTMKTDHHQVIASSQLSHTISRISNHPTIIRRRSTVQRFGSDFCRKSQGKRTLETQNVWWGSDWRHYA